MLAEFGIDSYREGEPAKCEMLAWQIETAFRAGPPVLAPTELIDEIPVALVPVREADLGVSGKLPQQSRRVIEVLDAIDAQGDHAGPVAVVPPAARHVRAAAG